MNSKVNPDHTGLVRLWLGAMIIMVVGALVIGAFTRLTGSGLSMVEWRPIAGLLPPLDQAEWQRIFMLYQQIPQYQLLNFDMNLAEFKRIFWWEYLHRIWGRLIGFCWMMPMIILWRSFPPWMKLHLLGLLGAGAMQGIIGWWMVKSGFSGRTEVEPLRLAVHLGLAMVILAWLIWLFQLCNRWEKPAFIRLRLPVILIAVFVAMMILSGALVAGSQAGFIFNDWPLMDGNLLPPIYQGGFESSEGGIRLFYLMFENQGSIQFHHRCMAYAMWIIALGLLWHARGRSAKIRLCSWLVFAAITLQIMIGIATVKLAVPIWLGIVHQLGAALIVVLLVVHATLYQLKLDHDRN